MDVKMKFSKKNKKVENIEWIYNWTKNWKNY